jgi:hypothetical protein
VRKRSNCQGIDAVDAAGDLYVADQDNSRVLKLAAGSSTQTVLPFTGLSQPNAVAVDAAWQPLSHRRADRARGEAAGGVMRRTAGARGCRASPTEAL